MRKVRWGVFGAVSPRSPLILLASVVAACGGGPQIKVMPDYRAHAAAGKKVFVVPLAVSDDLGDARTGIILSSETRATASLLACHEIASER